MKKRPVLVGLPIQSCGSILMQVNIIRNAQRTLGDSLVVRFTLYDVWSYDLRLHLVR
jgi:hypothetical protein